MRTGPEPTPPGRGRLWTRRAFLLLPVGGSTLMLQSPALAAPSDAPEAVVQTDGRVSAILLSGNTLYLGGTFLRVNGASRSRLAAIDAITGALKPWNPGANGWVMALAASPDGARVYAGGAFGAVGGLGRGRIAAIDAETGRVDGSWNPRADAAVRAIEVLGERVYLGGDFLSVNGESRVRLAAVSRLTGILDAGWRPAANNVVRTLAIPPDGTRVYAGGAFTSVSGLSRPHLLRTNPVTGEASSWRPAPGRPVIDLTVAGSRVYTAEGGAGGAAGAYDVESGATVWKVLGDGDAQAVTVHDGLVYVGGHFESLGGQARRMFAAIVPATGALDPQWNPSGDRGVWALTPDPGRGRLYAGGSFTRVNGLPRQGTVRFSE